MTVAAKAPVRHALARRVPGHPAPSAAPHAALPVRPRRVEDWQHAHRILALAPHNRAVLPRWGLHSPVRSAPAPAGAYTGTLGWSSREHYLRVVVPITVQLHRDVLRRHEIAVDTFRRFLAAKSLYAQEQRSGRTVIVRPDTIAGLAGLSERHVQKCNRAARELGLEIVLETGRMLSELEVYAARRRGSPQRGLSTVTAFVVPGTVRLLVYAATPTRGSGSRSSAKKSSTFKQRFAGQNGAPLRSAPPAPSEKSRPRPPGWRLAVDLTGGALFLRRCSPARVAPQLARFTRCPHRWTATQLMRAMDQVNVRLGYTSPVRARRSPWALLKWYLDQIDEVADAPGFGRSIG